MSECDLPVEYPDGFCGTNPEIVQDALGLALDVGLNSRVNDCRLHGFSVSQLQHMYQVIRLGQRPAAGLTRPQGEF